MRFLKLSLFEESEATTCADPDLILSILPDSSWKTARKSIGSCVVSKDSVCEVAQPGYPCSNPDGAGMILKDWVYVAVYQTLLFRESLNGLPFQLEDTFSFCPQPKVLFSILIDL